MDVLLTGPSKTRASWRAFRYRERARYARPPGVAVSGIDLTFHD